MSRKASFDYSISRVKIMLRRVRLTMVIALTTLFATYASCAAPSARAEVPPGDQKPNPEKKNRVLPVAPLPRLVSVRKETEEQKMERALLGCKRLEEAILAYQNHRKNAGRDADERLPQNPLNLVTPPFGVDSFLPKGEDELVDPWEQMYQYNLRTRKDGTAYVLIYTTAKDGTKISQFGIGTNATPKE